VNPAGYGALLLCGPLAVIAAVWLADRVGVPYPVLLVAVGAALAWLPGVNVPQLSPMSCSTCFSRRCCITRRISLRQMIFGPMPGRSAYCRWDWC